LNVAGRRRLAAEDAIWLGAIGATLCLAVAFAWITPQLAKLYPSPHVDVFNAWAGSIAPEPLEDVRAILTLATPFVLAAVIVLIASPRQPPRRSLDPLVVGAQVSAGLLLAWAVVHQPHTFPLVPTDYFEPLLISVPILVVGVLIGLALTALILRPKEPGGSLARTFFSAQSTRWPAILVALIVTAIWLLPAVTTDAIVAHSGFLAPSQIPNHAEDYLAVVNGRTPLVNYISPYASLLPLVIAPVLSAFGSSLTAFTVLMATLSGIGLMAIYGVFTVVTRRPWVALGLYAAFVALSLFPWHDHGSVREFNGNYFALFPDRLFGPFLVAFVAALSIRDRRIPVWCVFLLGGLALINNAEFGIGALVALVISFALSSQRTEPLRARTFGLATQAAVGLLLSIAIVCAVTLIRAGELPNPRLLTYFNRLFLRESFGLVPMPSLGLQWAMYLTYAGALLTAALRYLREADDRTLSGMLAYSGAFGLVTGMYFVGRSVMFQLMILFPVWGLCLALVAWTAAHALRAARGDRNRLRRLLIPATAGLIGLGVMIAAIARIPAPWSQIGRLSGSGRAVNDTPNAQRFIESHTSPGEKVLVIGTPLDHRLADRAGVANVSPLNGFISLISPAEADRSLDQLEDEGGTEVFEAVTAPSAINPSLFKIPEFGTILRERGYRLVEQDPSSGLRLWRQPQGHP
jgi:hypothetical protein